jgi:hypothetical protein
MPHLDEPLNGLEPSLVLTFLATFARLEFAMKPFKACRERSRCGGEYNCARSVRLPGLFEKFRANDDAKMLIEDRPTGH